MKRSPAKGNFVKKVYHPNKIFVQRANEGLMIAYVTKGANEENAAYIKPFVDILNQCESNELDICMVASRG